MREALHGYDNVLVVDQKGIIRFFDLADLKVLERLGYRPDEFIGKHVTDLYTDLTNDTSTIMRVIQTGQSIPDIEQTITAKNGASFHSFNSTYPLIENNEVIGAIEFSKHIFDNEQTSIVKDISKHQLFRKNKTNFLFEDFITQDSRMEQLVRRMRKVSKSDTAILLVGETGTGKDMLAHSIHNESNRANKPFFTLDCSMLAESQIELQLFGSVEGAFPGATDTVGMLESAKEGTLYLDKLSSLPSALQAKLLRVIDTQTIKRLGDSEERFLDIRIITSLNESPEEAIGQGLLRADLYYRLAVTSFRIPPLRERMGDVPVLLDAFIQFYNEQMTHPIDFMNPEIYVELLTHSWPGNVRELRNLVESFYSEAEDGELVSPYLPFKSSDSKEAEETSVTSDSPIYLRDQMDAYEKELIVSVWKETEGRIGETARRLGLSRQALKYKLNKFTIG